MILGLATTLAASVISFYDPSPLVLGLITGGLIFSGVMWIIGVFKRRSAYCPLCRGTPLINSQARVHTRATRLPPFNHGFTALLSILATHRFRCMYCGTDYDLFKGIARRRLTGKRRRH